MRKHQLALILAITITAACSSSLAESQEELVGSIANVKGTIHLLRGQNEVAAGKGTRLYASDIIRTDAEAGVGVVLRDDTTLSLGPSSELKMSEFKFKPDEGILGMTLSIAKGTLVYISGQIAKLAPGSAQIETPAGVAAVRGTELLVEVPATKAEKQAEKAK
ncbi:MAG TPA: FecR domain-containing protein [Candidatus Hydrogenedentes bacterium]|nr:FecR domain-containing protein [Candidatus Hydrogenedentota bacterium]HQM49407.1 FecR domain-containing protein [Candidatus Hydrogenedentota bacterium]